MSITTKLEEALSIIKALGLPRAQHNERSALCLLALCDMTPNKTWNQATNPYLGITPIMDWARTLPEELCAQHAGNRAPPNHASVCGRWHRFLQSRQT